MKHVPEMNMFTETEFQSWSKVVFLAPLPMGSAGDIDADWAGGIMGTAAL